MTSEQNDRKTLAEVISAQAHRDHHAPNLSPLSLADAVLASDWLADFKRRVAAAALREAADRAPEAERLWRVVDESEARLCECDRIDQRDNPHRHERDEVCQAWAVLGETVLAVMQQRDDAYAQLDALRRRLPEGRR